MISAQRKNEIKTKVIEIYRKSQITSMPVDLALIFDNYDWGFLTYEEARNKGIEIEKIHDGYTLYYDGSYLVLYNSELLPQRIRWTIAHEIGHIALGHALTESVAGFTANEEAQYFAEQLLAPAAVVAKLGGHDAAEIAQICNISREAAEWRESNIQRHLWYHGKYGYTAYDRQFLKQFSMLG